MRLLIWNCMGGLANPQKVAFLHAMKPDLAVIAEIREANIKAIAHSGNAIWKTNGSSPSAKGLAVIAFGECRLEELEFKPEFEIYLPVRVHVGLASFDLLAVWNFYDRCNQAPYKGKRGLEEAALNYHIPRMDKAALIAGDFNSGPTFKNTRGYKSIVSTLFNAGFVNVGEHLHPKANEAISHPTYRHSLGALHIIDHIFAPRALSAGKYQLEIPSFDRVVRSDHAPVILDFEPSDLLTHHKKAG